MDAEAKVERARLYWQCRRGMRELDLLLEDFLDHRWPALTSPQRQAFARMLTCQDAQLLDYLMGRRVPDDEEIADVVCRIRTLPED